MPVFCKAFVLKQYISIGLRASPRQENTTLAAKMKS